MLPSKRIQRVARKTKVSSFSPYAEGSLFEEEGGTKGIPSNAPTPCKEISKFLIGPVIFVPHWNFHAHENFELC